MNLKSAFLYLIAIMTVTANLAFAQEADQPQKTVKYRSHTQIDFTGQTIQGKIRTPEVFYIFQRKKTSGHNVITTPDHFDHHRQTTVDILEKALPL